MATILLAEDNEAVRLLTQAKLRHQFTVVTAANGREALDRPVSLVECLFVFKSALSGHPGHIFLGAAHQLGHLRCFQHGFHRFTAFLTCHHQYMGVIPCRRPAGRFG